MRSVSGVIKMPKIYSRDLREKVLNAVELDNIPKTEVSQIFGISRDTINRWQKLKAETGDIGAQPYSPPGNNHRVTDWEEFREFAQKHGDKTQAQMAELWDGQISRRTISRALARIGFTRKKKPTATAKETGKNERSSSKNSRP